MAGAARKLSTNPHAQEAVPLTAPEQGDAESFMPSDEGLAPSTTPKGKASTVSGWLHKARGDEDTLRRKAAELKKRGDAEHRG